MQVPTEVLLATQEQYELLQGWSPNNGLDVINFAKDGDGNWVANPNIRTDEWFRERFAGVIAYFDAMPLIPYVPQPEIEP